MAFVVPAEQGIKLLKAILEVFVRASSLHTNVSKCQLTPIRCFEDQIALVQSLFPCQLLNFPCSYLVIN
jgi:hypothetical protein